MSMLKLFKQDLMLKGMLISLIFYSIGSPMVKIEVMQSINPTYLSCKWIVENIFIILMILFYDKYSDRIFKRYSLILFTETVVCTALVCTVIAGFTSTQVFFILNVLISCTISRTITCCINRLKRLYYNGDTREKFDNGCKLTYAIGGICGSLISMLPITREIAWISYGLGLVIDNLFYYLAYRKIMTKQ